MATTSSYLQSELRPPFITGEFILNNFTVFLHDQTHSPVYCAPLRNELGTHLSAYMWLVTPGVISKYDFSIEMINQRNSSSKNHILRAFGYMFINNRHGGWQEFYPLNRLAVDGFLVNDEIKFRYQIRPSSYFELYKRSTRQLRELKNENEQLLEDIDQKTMMNEELEEEIEEKEIANEKLQDEIEERVIEYENKLDEKRLENEKLKKINEQLEKQFDDYKMKSKIGEDKKKRTVRKLWNNDNDENVFITERSRGEKRRASEALTSVFSILFVALTAEFTNEGSSPLAWVQSMMNSVPCLIGPIVSILTTRLGYRKTIMIYHLNVIARKLKILYLTMSFCYSFGNLLVLVATVVAVTEHFEYKPSFASALTISDNLPVTIFIQN
ncbi:unnamed protein product [Didymodactylos carnosus]|uniref:MATH domain-containing protein n=2 Tax=Didymodactylos carnosus TaxID=1234261 RepID=A0A8S2D434_9BILA|nr:unnamed protein product [Didymodactylos carnosus]CAF3591755.1 unnamed protein product [Didymodactylos carnosus]